MDSMNFETMHYEWHIRWEEIELPSGNILDTDLVDTGYQSLEEVKSRLTFTDDDISKGYIIDVDQMREGNHSKDGTIFVSRIELAKYDDIDGGYVTAMICDKKLVEVFDESFGGSIRVPKRFQKEFARNYEWASLL